MRSSPFEEIRWSWQGHKAALWWLGLLYRRPSRFVAALESGSWRQQLTVAALLWLHSLPYCLILASAGRWVLFGWLGLELRTDSRDLIDGLNPLLSSPLSRHLYEIASGIAAATAIEIVGVFIVGIASEIAGRFSRRIASAINLLVASGIVILIAAGTAFEIAAGAFEGLDSGGTTRNTAEDIALAIILGIVFGMLFGIGVGLSGRRIAGGAAEVVIGILFGIPAGFVGGIGAGFAGGIAATLSLFRVYYYPLQPIFMWPSPKGNWYPQHPVAWDDLCVLPFPGFDRLLVAYYELEPEGARQEIDRLIDHYPSQRGAALRARIALVAREAGQTPRLARLGDIAAALPEGKKGFLIQTPVVRRRMQDIATLQTRLDTIDRPFLREPTAELLCKEIENFQHQIGGFQQPLAREFRAASRQWLQIAQRQLEKTRSALKRQPVHQVFRAGDPVDRRNEAFIPRHELLGELESQIMLAGGCPGLLIFGRRRMGKSSLIRNLSGLLPAKVRPLVTSMLVPLASLSLWIGKLVDKVAQTLQQADADPPADLDGLFNFLSQVNRGLEKRDDRLLLIFDEYEGIDTKIGEGVFPVDLLATIRESIQSHRFITWIFVGRDRLDQMRHAPWTSYLVSVRTIEVPAFRPEETRLLLTEPLKYSTFWQPDDPKRPSFTPGFWGPGGIDRIHHEAGGWPHLVQLIAENVVDQVNLAGVQHADGDLLQRAIDKAVVRGDSALSELVKGESQLHGEWEYVCGYIQNDVQPAPVDAEVASSLRRRLLVTEENGKWRLRVPLMQRWLRRQ